MRTAVTARVTAMRAWVMVMGDRRWWSEASGPVVGPSYGRGGARFPGVGVLAGGGGVVV